MRYSRSVLTVLGLVLAFSASGAGFAGASVRRASGQRSSTPKKLVFRSNGTPILNGITIKVANSAGSAHTGDVHIYSMVQDLRKWGASVSMTNASSNIAELAVAGGSQDLCTSSIANSFDAGLTAFGPNQTAVSYSLLVPRSITSIKQLRGKSYGDADPSGNVDLPLWLGMAKKAGFPFSTMHLITTGDAANAYSALIAGRVSAIWADSGLAATAPSNFHVLLTAGQVAPNYADSMMFATPQWLKANPAIAEAVDLGWLASAKTFNTNESAWIKDALTYTSNAVPVSALKIDYVVLKRVRGFQLSESSFSKLAVKTNFNIAKSIGGLTPAAMRPLSQIADVTPWTAAWAQYSAHPKAY